MYPQVFGKYVLERELSRGGMARVLLATLRGAGGFEKRLVVKQIREDLSLDQEFVRRFVDEAKTTVALSHPNIVPVYELGVERGVYFLAMELVEGASVAELLRGEGKEKLPLSPAEGAYLGVEICRALDYAHRRMQVVHRDITPRNVMVDEEGQVKLIDFGIAARARAETEIFGSPGHMPPEQMQGGAIGPATDLFAVAVLLMEAWSGKAPFRRETAEASEEAMRGPHPKPSDADPRLAPLDDVIGRAMALDAKDRPQEADELARALRRFLSDVDVGDVARSLGERTRSARGRERAREEAREERKRASGGLFVPTPGVPLITKTFAARDDVVATGASPSTRKLAPSTPPGALDAGSATDRAKRAAESGEDRVETIATRPIETPVREGRRAQKGKRVWPLAALAAFALAGIFAWTRAQRDPSGTTSTKVDTRASSGASASAPPAADAGLATPVASSAPSSTGATESAPSAKTSPPSSAASATAHAGARVSFFGDPGTRVTIDGAARGACPLRDIALDPGVHEVRFVFEPTGESRGERITVPSEGKLAVRADFTGATPTLRIDRQN